MKKKKACQLFLLFFTFDILQLFPKCDNFCEVHTPWGGIKGLHDQILHYPTHMLIQYTITQLIFLGFYLLLGGGGVNSQHMEIPSLGVESELQLPACITATAMQDS